MDILMVVLRLIHIFSAFVWGGFAFSAMLFINPAAEQLGAEGKKFMAVLSNTQNFRRGIPSAAGLTVLSGLIMYFRLFHGLAPLNTGSGLALTVGGLAGLWAMFDGIQLGRMQQQLGEMAAAAAGKASAELTSLQEKVASRAAFSTVLMVVALAGMTLSEYFAF